MKRIIMFLSSKEKIKLNIKIHSNVRNDKFTMLSKVCILLSKLL